MKNRNNQYHNQWTAIGNTIECAAFQSKWVKDTIPNNHKHVKIIMPCVLLLVSHWYTMPHLYMLSHTTEMTGLILTSISPSLYNILIKPPTNNKKFPFKSQIKYWNVLKCLRMQVNASHHMKKLGCSKVNKSHSRTGNGANRNQLGTTDTICTWLRTVLISQTPTHNSKSRNTRASIICVAQGLTNTRPTSRCHPNASHTNLSCI